MPFEGPARGVPHDEFERRQARQRSIDRPLRGSGPSSAARRPGLRFVVGAAVVVVGLFLALLLKNGGSWTAALAATICNACAIAFVVGVLQLGWGVRSLLARTATATAPARRAAIGAALTVAAPLVAFGAVVLIGGADPATAILGVLLIGGLLVVSLAAAVAWTAARRAVRSRRRRGGGPADW